MIATVTPDPLRARVRRAILLLESVHLYSEVFGRRDVAEPLLAEAVALLEARS